MTNGIANRRNAQVLPGKFRGPSFQLHRLDERWSTEPAHGDDAEGEQRSDLNRLLGCLLGLPVIASADKPRHQGCGANSHESEKTWHEPHDVRQQAHRGEWFIAGNKVTGKVPVGEANQHVERFLGEYRQRKGQDRAQDAGGDKGGTTSADGGISSREGGMKTDGSFYAT
jgi:hypothetical protein